MDVAFSEDAFNPGRVLDNLFIPLFLPQAGTDWPGNVKKLKLRNSQGNGETVAAGAQGMFDQIVDVRG